MKRLILFVAVVCGCRPDGPTINGIKLTCGPADDHSVATCTGGGRAYKCVTDRSGCSIDDASSCGLVAQ